MTLYCLQLLLYCSLRTCVSGVHGHLVLGCIANKALRVSEGNIGRRGPVALIVGDDFDTVILPDTHTAVCGAQVNTNGWGGHVCFSVFLKHLHTDKQRQNIKRV
jgi:hypothetical protein